MQISILSANIRRRSIFIAGLIAMLAAGHPAYCQDSLPANFNDLLQKGGMSLHVPDSFRAVPLIANKQMAYEYAAKHVSEDLEIRYAIRPSDPKTSAMYPAIFIADLANISGKPASAELASSVKILPKKSVSKEFNADWAAFAMLKPANDFGKGYDFCAVLAIHKNNKGDGYLIFLSNSQHDVGRLMKETFYSLTFK